MGRDGFLSQVKIFFTNNSAYNLPWICAAEMCTYMYVYIFSTKIIKVSLIIMKMNNECLSDI